MSALSRKSMIVVLGLVLLLTACGDDDTATTTAAAETTTSTAAGGDWLAEIKAMAAQWRAPITEWPGPTEPIPSIPEGKSFVVIPCAMAAEGCKVQAEAFIEAATAVGWETTLIDGKGDPTEQNNAIQQAIAMGVDGIYIVSVDPEIVSGALANAAAAGIAVMAGAAGTDEGVIHEVALPGYLEGQMVAAQVIDMLDGNVKVGLFTGNEFKVCADRARGTKDILAMCPTCEIVVEIDFPVTSIGGDLVGRVEATLLAHPEINVLIAPYDGAADDFVQAVRQAGREEDVFLAAFNGNAHNLDFIRNGEVQLVDIAEGLAWEGWAGVDNFLRYFNDMPMNEDDGIPARIMVAENLPPAGESWEGDYDFRAAYLELWGL